MNQPTQNIPRDQQPTQPHTPADGPVGQPVTPMNWFRHMPTGGATVFIRPATDTGDNR